MEKVTVKEVTKFCRSTFWKFTQEERKLLNEALAKFEAEKSEAFIAELEILCLCERVYLRERDVTVQRTEKKRMLTQFEKTRKDLLSLVDRKVKTQEDKSVLEVGVLSGLIPATSSDLSKYVAACYEEHERLYWLMNTAAMQLKEIVSIIKSDTGEPGRPSGDAATGYFVRAIAMIFNSLLEKPTASINEPFIKIVELAIEACKSRSEDPATVKLPSRDFSRHIKAALKNL